jgi:DNA polymerase III subunit epsilon
MLAVDLLHHYREVSQKPLTVVDVETTGSIALEGRVTEISVLQATLADGIQSQQTALVNPQTHIPAKIVEITGITQAMVDAAAIAATVLPDYLPLLSSGVLTAHNLKFDHSFLQTEYARLGIPFSRPASEQLCTVQLARLMLPELPSRSLPNLVQHFQFSVTTSHRAEADTIACWLLAQRLLTEISNEPDDALIARFTQQWIPLKVAAQLLGCRSKRARVLLDAAGVYSTEVEYSTYSTLRYRRGDVEQVYYQRQAEQLETQSEMQLETQPEATQLSCF